MRNQKLTSLCFFMLAGIVVPAYAEEEIVSSGPAERTAYFTSAGFMAEEETLEADTAGVVADESPAVHYYSAACCGPHAHTVVQADALFFGRNNRAGNQVLVFDLAQQQGDFDNLLTTCGLDFDFEPGARVLLRREFCDGHMWEASYFGIYDWNAGATVTADGPTLSIPGALGRFSNLHGSADVIDVDYTAELHSAEINCIDSCCHCCGPWYRRVSWFAGFRYLNLDEHFNIRSTDFLEGTGDYNIHAYNNLYGAQIGGRIERWANRFGWEVTGKAGIFGNDVGQRQFVTDFPQGFLARPLTGADDGRAAFVGELNLSLNYRLTDVWSVRGGYNVLWIEGVALAPDQLDFTRVPASGTDLNVNGGVFAHGAHVGVAARW
jgi:hypothetical protein